MKDIADLRRVYEECLNDIRCGNRGLIYAELNGYSVEELEELAGFGWSDEIGEQLYEIFIHCRKREMNRQFVFDKESIKAIVRIDQHLKECCRRLKKETKTIFSEMLEQEKEHFYIDGGIKLSAARGDSFLACAMGMLDSGVLDFSVGKSHSIEEIDFVPLFDVDRNYADKVLSYNTQKAMAVYTPLEGCHIGYAFYKLYRDGCLSLQDIVEITEIEGEINPCYSFYSYKKHFS